MNKTKLQEFKKSIHTQIEQIQNELESLTRNHHDYEVYADWTDVASAETNNEIVKKIRNRDLLKLKQLKLALQRIEDGEFGECAECGEEISMERLKINPATLYCINCQLELEKNNRKQNYIM
jgi:DnaK suppressor protein